MFLAAQLCKCHADALMRPCWKRGGPNRRDKRLSHGPHRTNAQRWELTEPMLELHGQIEDACTYIKEQWDRKPHAGVILGTGLGPLVEQINVEASIEYESIPHFPKSTATSHRGRLVCGELCGLPIMAMEGRFHMYEGYPLKQITLPVRVMKALGAELLVVSNAAGGMNPYFTEGDIVVI